MIKAIALIVTCLLLVALPAASEAVPVVSTDSVTVHVGDTFHIFISINGAIDLRSWQFDLAFAPAIVRPIAVMEGPFLSESGTKTTLFVPGVIDSGTGHITLVSDAFLDLPPGPSGSGVLADIEFRALAGGVSPLTLSNVFLNFSDSGFQTQNGQIAAVPEPSTLMLVSVGFGAWAARRWRTCRQARAR